MALFGDRAHTLTTTSCQLLRQQFSYDFPTQLLAEMARLFAGDVFVIRHRDLISKVFLIRKGDKIPNRAPHPRSVGGVGHDYALPKLYPKL